MLERRRLLERKDLPNERIHDAMKTANACLSFVAILFVVTVTGIFLYVNRKRLKASFQQSSAIIVRKSNLVDVESDLVL